VKCDIYRNMLYSDLSSSLGPLLRSIVHQAIHLVLHNQNVHLVHQVLNALLVTNNPKSNVLVAHML